MDSKDLAGATVWLFLEGDFKVAGNHGTTGKDEISVRSRENPAKFDRQAESKVIPMKQDRTFLLSLAGLRR